MSDMPKVIWVHYTMDYCSDEPIEECDETKYIRADLVEPQADAKHPAMKAIDCLDNFIRNIAPPDDVCDAFETIRNYIEGKDND